MSARKDPHLVTCGAKQVRALLKKDRAASDLKEWRRILETNSRPQIAKLLESNSARAKRLRQSPALLAVLSKKQRAALDAIVGDRGKGRRQ